MAVGPGNTESLFTTPRSGHKKIAPDTTEPSEGVEQFTLCAGV
jgi:hypothetical protein